MRRRQQRIFPARHVAARRADRNIFVSQNDARQRFNLDIFQAVALVLSEVTHLLLRKADISNIAIRQLRIAVIDFLLRQAEVCAIELIELNRQLAHRCVTARFNIRRFSTASRTVRS